MLLSVIIAVYEKDEPRAVKQAIDSIIMQVQPPEEVVIVIDGPICAELRQTILSFSANESIDMHFLRHNVGRGDARNFGIRASRGEYFAIMDADDVSRPDRFFKQMAIMRESNLDLLGGGIEEFKISVGDSSVTRKVPLNEKEIRKLVPYRSPFNHVTLVVRRAIFNKVCGYNSLRFVEDWDFCFRVLNAGARVANISDVLVDVRSVPSRRQSFAYFLEEVFLLWSAKQRKQINIFQLGISYCLRLLKFIAPSQLMAPAYKYFLRS